MSLPWFSGGRFPLYLAPMAGFTDYAFRELCRAYGADVAVTEFVYADALLMEDRAATLWETIDFSEEQRPMGVQLFGANPEGMARAAALVVERLNPDFIDLNFGCPASRITCMEAGSSMLKNLPLMQSVAAATVSACGNTPVTAKTRLGWDAENIVVQEAAERLVDAGVQALAIHGRTKAQGYSGEADMALIEAVAARISIPVVANGNLHSTADIAVLRQGPVAGAMIGRAALGYPWLFREIKAALAGEPVPAPPTLEERWETLFGYVKLLQLQKRSKDRGAPGGDIVWMRPRIQTFTTGIPGGRKLRKALASVSTVDHLETIAYQHIKASKNP